MKMYGVECPECGDLRTGVSKAGFDQEGQRIRQRRCKNCRHVFTTVEAPISFVFNRLDVLRPDRARQHYKEFEAKNKSYTSIPRRMPDRLIVTARVMDGGLSNVCRKGLHQLEGDNLYLRSDGSRHCRKCGNANARAYRRRYPEYSRLRGREQATAARERRRAALPLDPTSLVDQDFDE